MPSRKVVYVTDSIAPYRTGGMPEVARRHVDWLAGAGYQLTVVHSWMERPSDDAPNAELIRLEWPEVASISRINPWKYVNALRNYSRQVSSIIASRSPSIIYSEGPLIDDFLRSEASCTTPTIFHPHGLNMFQDLGSWARNARAWPLRNITRFHAVRAHRVISQGGRLTNILRDEIGVPDARVRYVPNCTPKAFQLSRRVRSGHGARFLFVGRDDPLKGLAVLLSAFNEIEGAMLELVGPSRVPPPLANRVYRHGPIEDRTKLAKVFDQCDYLVVPSHSEGMATVILEAFSRGLPVIATDVGATSELVHQGKTGWLVSPGDVVALRGAIAAARDLSAVAYSALSTAANEKATREFSPDRVRSLLMDVFDELLAGSAATTVEDP